MSRFSEKTFKIFLKGVDLSGYRERFSKIKTVEMDLPYKIQALQTIYEQYWDNVDNHKKPLDFDGYYKIYWKKHAADIGIFWKTTGFGQDCDCFEKGLKARIYRTWVSLITQIHGGYVAETVFGRGSVRMGSDLDHKNIDIQVVNKDGSERFKIQIKKETHRPEIARMQKEDRELDGAINVYYIVVTPENYKNHLYKKNGKGYLAGDEKPFVKDFVKWYPKTGIMDRLPNGFTIFTKNAFKGLKN